MVQAGGRSGRGGLGLGWWRDDEGVGACPWGNRAGVRGPGPRAGRSGGWPGRRDRRAGAARADRGGAGDRQDLAGRAPGGACGKARRPGSVGSLLGGRGRAAVLALGPAAAGPGRGPGRPDAGGLAGAGAAAQVAQLLPGLAERLGVAALPPGPVRASEAAPRSSAASTATYTCRRCASPSTRPSPPLSHRPRRMPPDQASGRHRSSTASGTTSSGWPCCDGGAALGVTRLVAGAGLSFCQRA
jgi:hypothetical protein